MRLIDRWIRRDAGYWEGMASGAAVLTTSYGGPDREAILPSLAAWAQQAYGSSAVVFSAILARISLFSEARFQLQALDDKHLFGNTSLSILEHPWPDGSTGELLARMELDVSLAGNAYIWRVPGEDRLVRLRPDWTTIVSELVRVDGGGQYRRKIGYWTEPPKSVLGQGSGQFYPADEVAHWVPDAQHDPAADFRGMSWLTPVYRDIAGDDGLTRYKIKYLENSASPNLLIRYAQKLHPGTVDAVRERMHARYGGVDNAFKTLVLDQGADITVIGNSLQQMDFSNVSAAGEQRILAASFVPGVLVGLEPLRGAGRGYQESMQKFANLYARPQWRSACGALSKFADPPAGNRLWYDTTEIAALQDGELERGQAALVRGQAVLTSRQAGATLESAVAFVNSGDVTKLQADPGAVTLGGGNVQHQLPQQQPGATATPLPAGAQPRLPVGATSPGDGANGHPPAGKQLVSVRRAEIEAPPAEDDDPDDWQDGDDLDLDDLLADAEEPAGDPADAERFNPYHAKAGSATGGQFTSSSGGSGGAKANGAAKGHAAATTITSAHAGHAREKHELEAKAAADRAEARQLEEQLRTLVHQMHASVAAHKKAAAAAKASAHHKATARHHRKAARHHHRHARSLHSRISALRTRIRGLLAQARSFDAKAKAL